MHGQAVDARVPDVVGRERRAAGDAWTGSARGTDVGVAVGIDVGEGIAVAVGSAVGVRVGVRVGRGFSRALTVSTGAI